MMTTQKHNRIVRAAVESGYIAKSYEYEVMTIDELKDELVKSMINPNHFKFVDINKYIDDLMQNDDKYCWVLYDPEIEEWVAGECVAYFLTSLCNGRYDNYKGYEQFVVKAAV